MANISGELFPILEQKTLTGVAKLAAEAENAGEGHLIEFKAMKVRSILTKSTSKRLMWLAYSINPYRGCEFGCRYCYARYTHTFMAPSPAAENTKADSGLRRDDKQKAGHSAEPAPSEAEVAGMTNQEVNYNDPDLFERRIFIKQNAAWLLEQELRKIKSDEQIALGTATDPYQPIERKALVTRSILEVFARQSGLRLGIVTKSNLIVRDIELLQEIARRNVLVIHITITTPDVALARILEPRAPRPDLRFAAVRTLREAGLRVGVMSSPLLPGITDNAIALGEMARLAKEVDASFLAAGCLFLKPCSRPTYFAFVREHFPQLLADTERRFAANDFAAKPYAQRMRDLLQAVCKKHGVGERSKTSLLAPDASGMRKPAIGITAPAQQKLFG
jgi:DNA repair photolyase